MIDQYITSDIFVVKDFQMKKLLASVKSLDKWYLWHWKKMYRPI